MYSTDLLPFVLPLNSAPDFRDARNRIAPKYGKKTSINIRKYRMYNMINAQIYLHDEIDFLSPDVLIDQFILTLMYHPRFPDTFFNFIANSVDGIPTLQTENVEAFLDGNYGASLQQPDCEYLSLILELWRNRYTVLYYNNLNKALAWIEKKRQVLPPIWPVNPTAPPSSKVDEIETNTQPTKSRAESILLPKETEVLTKLLKGLGLLDDTNQLITDTGSGAVAGIIDFLYRKKLISSSRTAAFRTLSSAFGLTTGKRTIQGNKRASAISKLYYDKALAYFEEIEALR